MANLIFIGRDSPTTRGIIGKSIPLILVSIKLILLVTLSLASIEKHRPHVSNGSLVVVAVNNKSSTTTTTTTTTTTARPGNTHTTTKLPPNAVSLPPSGRPSTSAPQPAQLERPRNATKQYKLPSWFSFELYKQFHAKRYLKGADNELHKRIYLATALKVFEQRALYRANRRETLSSVNELSDMTTDELVALKARSGNRHSAAPLKPKSAELELQKVDCCSYDQALAKIIELLNKTSSPGESYDLSLSRALVDELEQKPLTKEEDSRLNQGAQSKLAHPAPLAATKSILTARPNQGQTSTRPDAVRKNDSEGQLLQKPPSQALNAVSRKQLTSDGRMWLLKSTTTTTTTLAPQLQNQPRSLSVEPQRLATPSPLESGRDPSEVARIKADIQRQLIDQLKGDEELKRFFSGAYGAPVDINVVSVDEPLEGSLEGVPGAGAGGEAAGKLASRAQSVPMDA